MRKIFFWSMILVFAFVFAACNGGGESANTANSTNENANAATPAEDASATVIDLDKKAHDAWKAKDGKYFEGMLADNFKGVVGNEVVDKASLVKQISENPCEVKSFELTEPKAVKINDSAYVVTHKLSYEYTCEGKSVKSPQYTASVYVKDGDAWKGAFHQSVTAADAKGDVETMADSAALKTTDDEDTKALEKLEREAWDAWAKGDTKWFEGHLAADALVVNATGVSSRDDMLKAMADTKCEVDQYSTKTFSSTKLTDNVYLLMYRGDQKGKCGDAALPPVVIASTVVVKDGDKWQGFFHIETPAK